MAKISDSIQVKVSQGDGEQGKRLISVTIVADKARFVLPELLADEGALVSIEKRLKDSCLREVLEFLTSGRKLLGDLRKQKTSKEGKGLEVRRSRTQANLGKDPVSI